MVSSRNEVWWELCRQGLPLAADEAAVAWENNQTFELERGVRLSRWVEALIRQTNWEVERTSRAC